MIDNLEDGFSDLRIGIAYISHHLYLDLHNLKGARDRQEDRTTNPQNIRASLKVVLTLKLNLNLFLHFQLLCIEKENSSFEQLLCWGIRKGKKNSKNPLLDCSDIKFRWRCRILLFSFFCPFGEGRLSLIEIMGLLARGFKTVRSIDSTCNISLGISLGTLNGKTQRGKVCSSIPESDHLAFYP